MQLPIQNSTLLPRLILRIDIRPLHREPPIIHLIDDIRRSREHGGRLRQGCRFRLNDRSFDTEIHTVDRLFVPSRNEMPVEIHSDLDGTMAHLERRAHL